MDPLLFLLFNKIGAARDRLAVIRRQPEAGNTTEYMIIIAAVAVMALAALGVIAMKLKAKADSIDLDGAP